MSFEIWLGFVAASAMLLMIPGPTVLLVLSHAMGRGWGVGLPMAVGVGLGDLTAMTLSLAGVGALLAASATLFTALKWAGAVYLIWLGVRLWRTDGMPAAQARRDGGSDAEAPGRLLAQAWLITVLNPKSILFFVAFVPQFVDPALGFAGQAAVMVATFVTLAFINALGYAILGARAGGLIRSPRAMRLVHCGGGTALIGAGAATAMFGRAA